MDLTDRRIEMSRIGEISQRMSIPASTLRYYDREGLLEGLERGPGGARVFTKTALSTLLIIHCLKQSGLTIKEIKEFIELVKAGDSSLQTRLELFRRKREDIAEKISQLKKIYNILDYKCWYYETSVEHGGEECMEHIKAEDLPEKYRQARRMLDTL